ncbi:MAG: hydroxymethylbilane synthase [Chloroflexi bacterium]|nr:hydroxymethylbilane synthase [Chloroflexota bacterium]
MITAVITGTRSSELAVWQAEFVAGWLRAHFSGLDVRIERIATQGDWDQRSSLVSIGSTGVFTAEIEEALRARRIDIAVHSCKDLPVTLHDDFELGAIPERGSVADVLISRTGATLQQLPAGATVGTSSLRRTAQLLAARPDLRPVALRGNVPTRLRKALEQAEVDAVVLAEAGIERLDLRRYISEVLPLEVMLPAPAQGALAVQCRHGDTRVLELLRDLEHQPTRLAVEAERAFLDALGAGCRLPVAALGRFLDGSLSLQGRVLHPSGAPTLEARRAAPCADIAAARSLGRALATDVLSQGAANLLAGCSVP